MSKAAIGLIVVVALAAAIAVTARDSGGPAGAAPGAQVVLFSKGEPQNIGDAAAQLAAARRVSTFDEFKSVIGADTALMIIDRSAFPEADTAFLRQQVTSGIPILGLNVNRRDLEAATDFVNLVGGINPLFKEYYRESDACTAPCYSFLYRSRSVHPVGHWGGGQQDFKDGLFSAKLTQLTLASQGLIEDDSGRAIPLEQFDAQQP
jgi:hypothetical protein